MIKDEKMKKLINALYTQAKELSELADDLRKYGWRLRDMVSSLYSVAINADSKEITNEDD